MARNERISEGRRARRQARSAIIILLLCVAGCDPQGGDGILDQLLGAVGTGITDAVSGLVEAGLLILLV